MLAGVLVSGNLEDVWGGTKALITGETGPMPWPLGAVKTKVSYQNGKEVSRQQFKK